MDSYRPGIDDARIMIESGIYQIRNLVNGKIYIGSSINFKDRWYHHDNRLKSDKHHSVHLQNSWNKYGKDNFIFEILELVENKNKLILREQYYLDLIKPWDIEIGYNINKNARTRLGTKHTEESKEKNRQSQLGAKGYWYGRGHECGSFNKLKSAEAKKKISDSIKLWWANKKQNKLI